MLAAAADLVVTAAGYNSFHEALYNRVPAIFVPQMSAFMDDQRARARAACDRGLAAMVEANELMTLERLVVPASRRRRGRGACAPGWPPPSCPSPAPQRAAQLIEELAYGPKQWSAIVSRIGPHDADDLDDLLAPFDPRRGAPGATSSRRPRRC